MKLKNPKTEGNLIRVLSRLTRGEPFTASEVAAASTDPKHPVREAWACLTGSPWPWSAQVLEVRLRDLVNRPTRGWGGAGKLVLRRIDQRGAWAVEKLER